ncbi:Clp protease ClpP [Brevibacillus composti]|uniref:ATP-dependent Clp protease proteolytic subunit n=1 Tax=Brevibacillus composti TaxID=2796470 RepID=A0A7T5ENA5_9BACL|nr:head maturation protease, ClpP-related [Brevibacillus composti]QQE75712.1 Clp protease ClpP [Brevibacillus composti]QUO42738.1 Clp protease ClpP [Brevibacillus composti]
MSRFWEFKNISDTEAELLLYGNIASQKPWWDEGDTVTPKQFAEDLRALGTKSNITVRINSVGGDVFAAHAIFTQLRMNPANITVIIDGIAASSATIVAMAGDTVKMPSNALFMIHDPLLALWGYYNSADFEKFMDTLETVKESIISSYLNRTSLERDTIAQMMRDETWMTAQEALDNGFIDEIITSSEVQAAVNGHLLVVNSIHHDLSQFKNLPSALPKTSPQAGFLNTAYKGQKQQSKKEDITLKTIDELKQAYPDLVAQIENSAKEAGAKAERERIKAIEEISNTIAPELVNKAKFEQPMNAHELAFEALKNDAAKGRRYLNDAEADNADSGVDGVDGQPADTTGGDKKEEVKNVVNMLANFLNKGVN